MAVHRAVLCTLSTKVGGVVVRDRRTGDWLVIMSPQITAGDRCHVFNLLMAQVDRWEQRGYAVSDVRGFLETVK